MAGPGLAPCTHAARALLAGAGRRARVHRAHRRPPRRPGAPLGPERSAVHAAFTAVPLAGFYAGVAAAIMSKGPMGLIGLGAGVVAIAATDGWAGTRRLRPWLGLGVLAVLLLPWYGTYLTAHAPASVGDTVVGHYGSWRSEERRVGREG